MRLSLSLSLPPTSQNTRIIQRLCSTELLEKLVMIHPLQTKMHYPVESIRRLIYASVTPSERYQLLHILKDNSHALFISPTQYQVVGAFSARPQVCSKLDWWLVRVKYSIAFNSRILIYCFKGTAIFMMFSPEALDQPVWEKLRRNENLHASAHFTIQGHACSFYQNTDRDTAISLMYY